MPRPDHWKTWKRLMLGGLLGLLFFMGVMPVIEGYIGVQPETAFRLEWVRSRVMAVLLAAWFFAFGSMVGSFVNVVVWRMPRGVSVVSQGSACPWCQNKIRLADNIPIIGWLKLGGRCRVCRLPISPRYPVVEAIFGFVFLAIFLAELATAAANLPGQPRYEEAGILQIVMATKWDMIGLYAWHTTLVTMLLIWALMQLDGSRIPQKTIVFALLVGFAGPIIMPWIQPVKWLEPREFWLPDLVWLQRVDTGFIGLTTGYLAGGMLDQLTRHAESRNRGEMAIGLMTVGLFLGWQGLATVMVLCGIMMLISVALPSPGSSRMPALGWVVFAAVIQICVWRWIDAAFGTDDLRSARYLTALATGASLMLLASRMGKSANDE